jgi:hypothetical protein
VIFVARFFNLTDNDPSILGPIALIVAGIVIGSRVFSPATVDDLVRHTEDRGGS